MKEKETWHEFSCSILSRYYPYKLTSSSIKDMIWIAYEFSVIWELCSKFLRLHIYFAEWNFFLGHLTLVRAWVRRLLLITSLENGAFIVGSIECEENYYYSGPYRWYYLQHLLEIHCKNSTVIYLFGNRLIPFHSGVPIFISSAVSPFINYTYI